MAISEDTEFVLPPNTERVPRYAGLTTFARLPRAEDVDHVDIGVLGIPFDSGVTFRPGARFGPSAVREASRLLQNYNQHLDVSPFHSQQVADMGDVATNPFNIESTLDHIEEAALQYMNEGTRLVSIGGDHTVALPLLRAMTKIHGPVALLHFDAHLDTWDTYFGQPYTHGTPFLRAHEEGLLRREALCHIGTRAALHDRSDLVRDDEIGFGIISSTDVARMGPDAVVDALCERIG